MKSLRIKKVRRLCQKFYDDLQAVFDEMEASEYETPVCETATLAQGYAEEAAKADEQ